MSDEPTEEEITPGTPDEPGDDAVGSWRDALRKRDSKGRPMAVYAILGAAVASLIGLMLIVYFWSADRDRPEQPICTTISAAQAQEAVLDGKVEVFTLVASSDIETPTANGWGPVLARLDYADGQCGYLPQGVQHQTELFAILGTITYYNETTEGAQLDVKYTEQTDLDAVLFQTPTMAVTETPTVTEPAATPEPTSVATDVPVLLPTVQPTEVPASPMASPASNATPEVELTATPTATP